MLQEAEQAGRTLGSVCGEHGTSEPAFRRWKRGGHDGTQPSKVAQGAAKEERSAQARAG